MYVCLMVEGTPDSERKGCFDCLFRRANTQWMCIHRTAIGYRKSCVPNTKKCSFWKPVPTIHDLPEEHQNENVINGFVLITPTGYRLHQWVAN